MKTTIRIMAMLVIFSAILIPVAAAQSINACYSTRDGTIRILLSGSCKNNEVPLSFYTKAYTDSTIKDLRTSIKTLESNLQGSINTLQSDVTALGGSISTLQSNVTSLQGSVGTLQENVSSLQGSVSPLQASVLTLQGKVSTLEGSVGSLSQADAGIMESITALQTQLTGLQDYLCAEFNASGAEGCPSFCSCSKKVFITSQYAGTGNLGGLAGADAKCQSLAEAAGLKGTFKAWLSDSTATPLTRFTHAGSYVLVDGTQIASDWQWLLSHYVQISQTEYGRPEDHQPAWTGTAHDGSSLCAIVGCCSDWTVDTPYPAMGAQSSSMLEPIGTVSCNQLRHLICFQQ